MVSAPTPPASEPIPADGELSFPSREPWRGEERRPIRVVLAVEDPLLSAHLRDVLYLASGEFEVVAATASPASARRFTHGYGLCVLVLDLSLGDGACQASIGAIRAESPDAGIVVLAKQTEAGRVCSALRAGATGYVLQENMDDALRHAVRRAADGRGYLIAVQPGSRVRGTQAGRLRPRRGVGRARTRP